VHDNIHISQLPSFQVRFPREGSNEELPCLELGSLKNVNRRWNGFHQVNDSFENEHNTKIKPYGQPLSNSYRMISERILISSLML
jgi:hypothetical protein